MIVQRIFRHIKKNSIDSITKVSEIDHRIGNQFESKMVKANALETNQKPFRPGVKVHAFCAT